MPIDARTLADGSLIEGDLCIVGAGAAGISIALDWANASRKVIVLEGGGFEYEDEVQELYRGTTSGQKYFPLKSARLHYFGGTTGHWAGMCAPFDPVDFVRRDWVPHSGWPITREDLEPYYVRANPKVQIGPYPYGFAYWRRELPNLTPFPLDEAVVWNKMWQFSQARFGTLYREEIVRARNIHLYTHANVVDIRANEGLTAIEEVVAKNATGKSYRVRAKHFVLACCAIQNARRRARRRHREGRAPVGPVSGDDVHRHDDRLPRDVPGDRGPRPRHRAECLEAPVLGSRKPAAEGTLTILTGGDADLSRRMEPLLRTMGSRVIHMGDTGMAAHMKLLINQILGALLCAFAEAALTGITAGLPAERILEVIEHSVVACPAIRAKGPDMLGERVFTPHFPLKHARKDVRLAVAAGERAGIPTPVTRATQDLFAAALGKGYGDRDVSAVLRGLTDR